MTVQHCTFLVDGLTFGVSVSEVQEVLRAQQMTAVPHAPESVRGLLNLRGEIVAAIDLRHRLGLPDALQDTEPMNVVVRSRGEVVSLVVDDIGEVLDLTGLPVSPAPSTLPPAIRDVVTGVVTVDNTLLLLLDADRTADVGATHSMEGTP